MALLPAVAGPGASLETQMWSYNSNCSHGSGETVQWHHCACTREEDKREKREVRRGNCASFCLRMPLCVCVRGGREFFLCDVPRRFVTVGLAFRAGIPGFAHGSAKKRPKKISRKRAEKKRKEKSTKHPPPKQQKHTKKTPNKKTKKNRADARKKTSRVKNRNLFPIPAKMP